MKKMYYFIIAFPVFLFMVLLYPVSAKAAFVSPFAVTIGGVEYILSEDGKDRGCPCQDRYGTWREPAIRIIYS